MDNTIIQQGTFTAQGAVGAGQPVFIPLRSSVDWMRVINYTQSLTNNINTGVEFFWQRGMPVLDSLCYYHVAADHTLSSGSSLALGQSSFYWVDENSPKYGPLTALTRVNAYGAGVSVVLTANTAGLYVGSMVRLVNVPGALQLCNGPVFSVTAVNAGVSFSIRTPVNTVDTGVVAGFFQIVFTPDIFAPRELIIVNVTAANPAVVRTATPHLMSIGQKVRFSVPQITALAYGMLPLDGMTGTVTAIIDAWNFSIDIDTTLFPAFTFPLTADVAFTYAQVIPFGENTAAALAAVPPADILADAMQNIAQIGMVLLPGAYGPAGQILHPGQVDIPDVIYWVAGKSFNV